MKGNPESSAEDITQLFRKEAVSAARQDFYGCVSPPLPRLGWGTAAFSFFVFCAVLAGIFFGNVDRKERALGRMIPASGLNATLSPASGTISKTVVAEGQSVSLGDVVMIISTDPSGSSSDGNVTSKVAKSLQEQVIHLRESSAEKSISMERERNVLQGRIAIIQQELAAAEREFELRSRQSEIAMENLTRIRPLRKERILSEIQIRQYENTLLDADSRKISTDREVLRLRRELGDTIGLALELPARAQDQRNEIELRIKEIEQSIARNDAQRSIVIRAVASGTISAIGFSTGESVREGQRLFSIAPEGNNLYAELWVNSRTMEQLRKDHDVYMRQGNGAGGMQRAQKAKIIELGEVPFAPAGITAKAGLQFEQPAFRVVVAPLGNFGRSKDDTPNLRPGSAVEADLILERKPIYQLLIPSHTEAAKANADNGSD
ncbi:HlyD family efflux transporter periplasmic adaptor subunit [Stenotrophomonas sp. PFBMAA-4]|uniref:HlyD family secretion protein n=1 Tax=Stenotrophomonas sp. PFBMAA-4 TaxID=3043301 RepID=UPI0024B5893C|nr:HlyD family efflux transporter periplasmic adaptor subunit [Stenotrophomonas sp. PFBMAA-4]MDI9273805.1 HlyD family efflux transporter periplasmic adaptor subunit [Stenotrophomonas sp. PFBMAA-4]